MNSVATFGLADLTPPPRETLQEKVYSELRQALMRGRFAPGFPLTIRAVATALGTSAMPVREALRQLVAERAIVTLASRSFGTPILTLAQFRDLVSIRIELEGLATERAAGHVTSELVGRLADIEGRMKKSESEGDNEQYIALNQQFHFSLYEASGSGVVVPLIETLWLQAGPYIASVFKTGKRSQMPHTFHEGIIGALEKRDGGQARKMLAADLQHAASIIERNSEFSDA